MKRSPASDLDVPEYTGGLDLGVFTAPEGIPLHRSRFS